MFAKVEADVGGFPFLRNPPPPLIYTKKRAFLFGRSYTDWYFHPSDETLMCQIGGSKRVALLAPDQRNWDTMLDVVSHERFVGVPDSKRFPEFRKLRFRSVIVDHGDALYIPPYWWHAVESVDGGASWGATIAWCWGSPMHILLDPRFPARQFYLKNLESPASRFRFLRLSAKHWFPAYLRGRVMEAIPS